MVISGLKGLTFIVTKKLKCHLSLLLSAFLETRHNNGSDLCSHGKFGHSGIQMLIPNFLHVFRKT